MVMWRLPSTLVRMFIRDQSPVPPGFPPPPPVRGGHLRCVAAEPEIRNEQGGGGLAGLIPFTEHNYFILCFLKYDKYEYCY